MTEAETTRFKELLEARRDELRALSSVSEDARKPVELDQQSIGRLSRQDALQQQAMAKAQEARRRHEGRKIDAALIRITESEYGWCCDCGEAIDMRRLAIDLTTTRCADCANALGN